MLPLRAMIPIVCLGVPVDRATGQVAPTAKGHLKQESASVDISLLQDELDSLVNAVDAGVGALTVDWKKVDEAIENWFNAKK